MRLIKNAHVYGVPLPKVPTELMSQQLSEHLFQDPSPSQSSSIGFVPNPVTGDLVSQYQGGWSISVRIDEKILPPSVVGKEVDERVAKIEEEQGRTVFRKERLTIKDDVTATLLARAFVKSSIIHVFYQGASGLLLVAVASNSVAIQAIALMREAFGSMKAVPLDIDSLPTILTEGLRKYFTTGSVCLRPFQLGGYLRLDNDLSHDRLVIDSGSAEPIALDSLHEALQGGYRVASVALRGPGASFKLSPDLSLKKITFDDPEEQPEFDGLAQFWRHEAAVQVMLVCNQVQLLLELCGSLFPVQDEAAR